MPPQAAPADDVADGDADETGETGDEDAGPNLILIDDLADETA